MTEIMRSNLAEPFPIPIIASHLGKSQKHLLNRCRRALGRTPAEHYTHLRLEHALDLLKTTELSVTEVAVATGYASLAGFSKSFKKTYGVSPRVSKADAGG